MWWSETRWMRDGKEGECGQCWREMKEDELGREEGGKAVLAITETTVLYVSTFSSSLCCLYDSTIVRTRLNLALSFRAIP